MAPEVIDIASDSDDSDAGLGLDLKAAKKPGTSAASASAPATLKKRPSGGMPFREKDSASAKKRRVSEGAAVVSSSAASKPLGAPQKPGKAKAVQAPLAIERNYKRIEDFILDSECEVRLTRRTLTAFNCGGQVFKCTMRGKGISDMLQRFEDALERVDGEANELV